MERVAKSLRENAVGIKAKRGKCTLFYMQTLHIPMIGEYDTSSNLSKFIQRHYVMCRIVLCVVLQKIESLLFILSDIHQYGMPRMCTIIKSMFSTTNAEYPLELDMSCVYRSAMCTPIVACISSFRRPRLLAKTRLL